MSFSYVFSAFREDAEPQGEEYSQKWSEQLGFRALQVWLARQYLAMSAKLGEMEKDGDGAEEKKKKSHLR